MNTCQRGRPHNLMNEMKLSNNSGNNGPKGQRSELMIARLLVQSPGKAGWIKAKVPLSETLNPQAPPAELLCGQQIRLWSGRSWNAPRMNKNAPTIYLRADDVGGCTLLRDFSADGVFFVFFNSTYANSVRQHIKPYEPHSLPWLMEFPISRLENVSQLGVSVWMCCVKT